MTSTDPEPADEPVLREGDRWQACSAEEFGSVGETRHIGQKGALNAVCGASASHPEIWRGNSTKEPCPACVLAYRHGKA